MSFTAIADDGFGVSVAAGALEGLALAFDDSDDADEQPTIATSKKSESNFTKRPFAFPAACPLGRRGMERGYPVVVWRERLGFASQASDGAGGRTRQSARGKDGRRPSAAVLAPGARVQETPGYGTRRCWPGARF